jgi:hypothetical protein
LFALSTSYSMLLLAERTLGNAVSAFFLGEVPYVATTVVTFSPLVAGVVLAGTAIAGVCAYKNRQEKKKFENKVKFHKDRTSILPLYTGKNTHTSSTTEQ